MSCLYAVGNDRCQYESYTQSFSFPLSDFLEAESKLDVAGITEVRFVFDRTEKGTLILDNIGFRELMEH